MSVKCSDIIDFMEKLAPIRLAEKWDNVGLLLGNLEQEIKKVMVCLDVTTKTVEEAVTQGVDLIISHHPLIFDGLKRVTYNDIKGRTVIELVKNSISVYSAHTNLDAAKDGVNECLARILGLDEISCIESHYFDRLYKVVVFVPEDSIDKVRDSMCSAGAGHIQNYSDCSFSAKGTGTFKPLENTNPYIGTQGVLEKVTEYRLETVVDGKNLKNVIDAMIKAHPYEEVAYDVYALEYPRMEYGYARIGILEKPLTLNRFIDHVKSRLDTDEVRLVGNTGGLIKKVAVFSGAFNGDLSLLARSGADVLVTGDLKYHTALEAVEKGYCIIDAGHFATERVVIPHLANLLKQRFDTLDVVISHADKNPFKHC